MKKKIIMPGTKVVQKPNGTFRPATKKEIKAKKYHGEVLSCQPTAQKGGWIKISTSN